MGLLGRVSARVSGPRLPLFGLRLPPTILLLLRNILAGQQLPDTTTATTSSYLLSRSRQAELGVWSRGSSNLRPPSAPSPSIPSRHLLSHAALAGEWVSGKQRLCEFWIFAPRRCVVGRPSLPSSSLTGQPPSSLTSSLGVELGFEGLGSRCERNEGDREQRRASGKGMSSKWLDEIPPFCLLNFLLFCFVCLINIINQTKLSYLVLIQHSTE